MVGKRTLHHQGTKPFCLKSRFHKQTLSNYKFSKDFAVNQRFMQTLLYLTKTFSTVNYISERSNDSFT